MRSVKKLPLQYFLWPGIENPIVDTFRLETHLLVREQAHTCPKSENKVLVERNLEEVVLLKYTVAQVILNDKSFFKILSSLKAYNLNNY